MTMVRAYSSMCNRGLRRAGADGLALSAPFARSRPSSMPHQRYPPAATTGITSSIAQPASASAVCTAAMSSSRVHRDAAGGSLPATVQRSVYGTQWGTAPTALRPGHRGAARLSVLCAQLASTSGAPAADVQPAPSPEQQPLAALVASQQPGGGSVAGGYKLPPVEIASIVQAPAQPALSYSPDRSMFLQLSRPPSLPPIYEMARAELKLAGLRVDPDLYARSKMSYYTDMSIVPATETVPAPADRCKPIVGYPPNSWINYVSWSPDGTYIAFTVRSPGGPGDPPRRPLELWVGDAATGQARPAMAPGQQRGLNTVFDDYCWLDDTTLIAAVLPAGLGAAPQRPPMPPGPKVQDNTAGRTAQNRTWPDLFKDDHDVALFDHYGASEVVVVDVLTGNTTPIAPPRMYIEVDPSPDGQYLLVSWLERPYSFTVPCGRFPKRTQLWRRDGSLVREVASLPLAEDIPIAFNSCRVGPRGIGWRDDQPAELYWIEAQDGGDPAVEVSPRDIVYTLRAEDAAASPAAAPQELARTDLRCGGVAWCDGDLAIVFESWYKSRRSVWWRMSPDRRQEGMKVIFDRNYEDTYGDPGSPLTRRTEWGTYTIARISPDPATLEVLRAAAAAATAAAVQQQQEQPNGVASENGSSSSSSSSNGVGSTAKPPTMEGLASGSGTWFLMEGSGASPAGNVPFLDLLHLESGETHRLWRSSSPYYEVMGSIMSDLDPKAPVTLEGLRLSMSREAAKDPPQTYIRTLTQAASKWDERQVTNYPHPYPQLRDLQREVIRYERGDGVTLTGTLYLPPGYDKERDGPLPCILWAYPKEYKTKEAAGQMRRSLYQFSSIGSTSPTLWLGRGYAVLDGPTLPIVADDPREGQPAPEPNDTFIEQLTAGARAAVDEVVKRGVADPKRMSIGGHSYGAFMTANLLAHAPGLFAAGIARTGAYNRTLTPFGFQNEERTIWQAPDVYAKMSPFMHANLVKDPLLLIHGEDDNNPGTFPMQSERFYQALKGHGATCRLVLLPHESHGYRAFESIMHTLYEQDQWLERFAGYSRLDPSYVTDDSASATDGSASE